MRRLFVALLVGVLALGTPALLALPATGALPATHEGDDHDDHEDKPEDCDSSGSGNTCDDDDSGRGRGRGRGGEDDDDRATQAPAAPGAAADATGALEVRMAGERFSPATLTITAGQSVTFVNDDDDEHTATGAGFDTGTLNAGDTATITFDEPGTFVYVCQFHADMQAEIVVLPAEGTPATGPAASPAASPAVSPAAAAQAEVQVEILNFEFSPATLTIAPGTTVVWTNTSPTPHTVTGDFADSGIMESGDTFSWTFTEPGTWDYLCALHPDMTAQIVVDPNAPPAG